MNTLYNLVIGKKNPSIFYANGGPSANEISCNEVVDENGFVMVTTQDTQQGTAKHNRQVYFVFS